MAQNTQQQQQRTITLLGKRINAKKLQQLINNTLNPAETLYNQVYNALKHGIPPQSAYNLPQNQLYSLRRYERARALYKEYQQHYNYARADYILTPAKPSHRNHIIHFFCGTTSDKHTHTYTKYRVTLAHYQNTLHLVCDCPDYTNRGGSIPCKHSYVVCMWLRDYMGGKYRG